MKIRNPFIPNIKDKELRQIESTLSDSLVPTVPRADFKNRLRNKLVGGEIVIAEKQILGMDLKNFYTLLVIVGGLIGGGIVLLSGAWVLILFLYKKGHLDWAVNLLGIGKNSKSAQTTLPTA